MSEEIDDYGYIWVDEELVKKNVALVKSGISYTLSRFKVKAKWKVYPLNEEAWEMYAAWKGDCSDYEEPSDPGNEGKFIRSTFGDAYLEKWQKVKEVVDELGRMEYGHKSTYDELVKLGYATCVYDLAGSKTLESLEIPIPDVDDFRSMNFIVLLNAVNTANFSSKDLITTGVHEALHYVQHVGALDIHLADTNREAIRIAKDYIREHKPRGTKRSQKLAKEKGRKRKQ